METIAIGTVQLEVARIAASAGAHRAPIVFLHEGLGSVAMWRDWPAQVCAASGRAGLVYSRRGYGWSEPIADVRGAGRLAPDYMHREALDVLPQLLSKAGLDRPVLLGHSDGGSIALIHAAHHAVAACVVMAPHVIVEDVSVRAIAQAREGYETGDLRERLRRYHADVDSAFWQWNDIWLNEAFRAFDIRQDCRAIRSPVLAIQGIDDPYGTPRQIDEIAPTLGRFEQHLLPACGHSPQRDQPEVAKGLITRFLAGVA
jgi:pimeloyl-ACP methyl ester carboxylesterase